MKKFKYLISCIILILCFVNGYSQSNSKISNDYSEVQKRLKEGWGTFDHRSVFNHVLLTDGLSLNLCFSRRTHGDSDNYLKEAFISSRGGGRPEKITPGMHAYDASYTELTCEWQGSVFKIESAVIINDLFLLVTPIRIGKATPGVVLEVGMLWNREGNVRLFEDSIIADLPTNKVTIRSCNPLIKDQLPTTAKYLVSLLDQPVAYYTGKRKSLSEVKSVIAQNRVKLLNTFEKYKALSETYQAIQSVVGWNIIYDASNDRVIYPVSRIWNQNFGGHFVLFDWDTYFASYMVSMENRDLAYANAIEITKSITPGGFIPNFNGSYNEASYDRSQPPVGSFIFKELYRKFQDKWLLEYVFDDLLTWNRWWPKNRDNNGLLCWGSSLVKPPLEGDFATNSWQGAAYESGLDNSPMYDSVPFNKQTHMLELADAGLMGLYVMDCDALSEIASVLGKAQEAKELKDRGNYYRKNLSQLWDEKAGIYKNKRTDTGEFSERLSPTNFYPMLAKAPTQLQAERMIKEHFLNPDEFHGDWIMPSIARNDPAFKDQEYWRGRIWGPMNFLVYLGFENYDLPEAKQIMAKKSNLLMMENVKLNGYIYENYNANTGNISDPAEARRMSDNYYHWGALLGFISFIENGNVANPMKALK